MFNFSIFTRAAAILTPKAPEPAPKAPKPRKPRTTAPKAALSDPEPALYAPEGFPFPIWTESDMRRDMRANVSLKTGQIVLKDRRKPWQKKGLGSCSVSRCGTVCRMKGRGPEVEIPGIVGKVGKPG